MNNLRIDVADLLRRPGARRPVRFEASLDALDLGSLHVVGPVGLDLLLERVPEGIVARGAIHACWRGECSTCLRELTAEIEVSVAELFEATPVDGETYPLEGHEIDLEQLVRDTVLLDLPLAPTCTSLGLSDCHERLVELAADHAEIDAADAPVLVLDGGTPDPRWAVLSELDL